MGEGKLLFSFPQAPIFRAFNVNKRIPLIAMSGKGLRPLTSQTFEKV